MELEKAIDILKENRDVAKQRADGLEKNKLTDFLDIQYKIDKEDYEAIDTVLAELNKLNKRIEYALDFAVDYDGYYNFETKQGNADGLAMTIDDMVTVLKGNLKGVE